MIIKKIEEGPLISINQRNAGTSTIIKNVLMEIIAKRLITGLKSSIIQINTKQNFVLAI
jgi:hypothetical protein